MEINLSEIENDIRKYLKAYSKAYTEEASRQLTEKTKLCIEMFYNDYDPIYYDRTFDLKNNSYVPYLKNNGKAYYGGVRITADFMSPYYSGGVMDHAFTDPIIVAQLAWHGWHGDPTGYNGKFIPIHTTPPLNVLTTFFKSREFRNNVENYAEKNAMSQNYKYLKFK